MSTSRRQFVLGAVAGSAAAALAACTGGADEGSSGAATAARTQDHRGSASPTSSPPSPSPTVTGAPAGSGADLVHGPRTARAVALTFHGAGDPALTRRVLSEARAADARLTVLAVGSWLEASPSLAREVLDQGHELGNHTWTHLPMRRLSAAQARSEIGRAADLLVRLTGSPGRWFRPSGTPSSTPRIRAAARAAGYSRCLGYDVDPRDYQDPGRAAILSRLEQDIRPGSVVSLHLGHRGTVEALPQVFDLLRRKGLKASTVSELVSA